MQTGKNYRITNTGANTVRVSVFRELLLTEACPVIMAAVIVAR